MQDFRASPTTNSHHLLQRGILSSCITGWYGNYTVSDRKTLQRMVRTAEKIIGASLRLSQTPIATAASTKPPAL